MELAAQYARLVGAIVRECHASAVVSLDADAGAHDPGEMQGREALGCGPTRNDVARGGTDGRWRNRKP